MVDDLRSRLESFTSENGFRGRGPLCVALVVTQHAVANGLPLSVDELVTDGGGQVLGLGRGAVQTILARHGLTRVLAAEGGRTSRGSLGNMREYVSFLNTLAQGGPVDLVQIEQFWVSKVQEFFSAKPFRIRLDTSRSLRVVVRDVLAEAEERQRANPGVQYAGAVMQHLVGAKLECALGEGVLVHNSHSTADSQLGRAGDFQIADVAIHVTTSPSEALISKCLENLNDGLKPILITLQRSLPVAEGLAANPDLLERIDVFEIEQFIALNLYELARFAPAGRKVAVDDLVRRYNQIVDQNETDHSLKIEFKS